MSEEQQVFCSKILNNIKTILNKDHWQDKKYDKTSFDFNRKY